MESNGIQFHSKELEWNWNGIGMELEWNWNGIGMESELKIQNFRTSITSSNHSIGLTYSGEVYGWGLNNCEDNGNKYGKYQRANCEEILNEKHLWALNVKDLENDKNLKNILDSYVVNEFLLKQ